MTSSGLFRKLEPLVRKQIKRLRLRGVTTQLKYYSEDVAEDMQTEGPPAFRSQPSVNTKNKGMQNLSPLLAAHLRETEQRQRSLSPTQAPVVMQQIQAFEWHLEEIHVTWAQLEKNRTRLRLYTNYLEEKHTVRGDGVANYKRRRQSYQVMASWNSRRRQNEAELKNPRRPLRYDGAQAKRFFGNEKVWVEMHRGIAWDTVENPNPQSTPQVLPSFEEYTPPMTHPEEVEKTIGFPMEEIPSFDEPKPQPQPLLNCPPLGVNLGDKRGTDPPVKPHSLDSFRMKVVDKSTINTPPSPHVASFHPKDIYCYYHPCVDDPKKHYGFKPGLLGQGGSLGVDLLN
ncbi:hypothetical protein Tco_1172532 [Tanacetum coccineum]